MQHLDVDFDGGIVSGKDHRGETFRTRQKISVRVIVKDNALEVEDSLGNLTRVAEVRGGSLVIAALSTQDRLAGEVDALMKEREAQAEAAAEPEPKPRKRVPW